MLLCDSIFLRQKCPYYSKTFVWMDLTCSFCSSINTHHLHFILPFSPPFLPPVHSLNRSFLFPVHIKPFFFLLVFGGSLAMMFDQEAVQSHFPVYETGSFTADEIQEILSILQSDTRVSPNSGSEVSNRSVYSVEERKRRRMVSNRESARRSRWRKKRHVEDLTNRLNQLRVENRVLKNRLGLVLNQYYVVERENDQLRSESVALWTRLSALYQTIVAMQSQ